jgi:hypothetical protein
VISDEIAFKLGQRREAFGVASLSAASASACSPARAGRNRLSMPDPGSRPYLRPGYPPYLENATFIPGGPKIFSRSHPKSNKDVTLREVKTDL